MAEEYGFDNTTYDPAPAPTFSTSDWDTFFAGVMNSLSPDQQQVATSLGGNDLVTYFPSTAEGTTIGGVAGTKTEDPKKEPSMISKWWASIGSDDKKLGLSALALLGGGLANIGKGRREDKSLSIQQQNADTNAAAVAERAREFNQQMANGSAIGQTNFGTATQPMGMINAPVTLTRNRLRPTPGAPQ